MLKALLTLTTAAAFLSGVAWAEPATEALEKIGAKIKQNDGQIVELSVETKEFTEAEFRLIGECVNLKKLSISGTAITDNALALLAGLTELEQLSTDRTRLSDDGYKHFAPFQKLKSLALFHPSWSQKEFTGKGLAHLKALPNLERLTFAGSTAGDEAMAAVSEITQLKEFSTWHTGQTQAGNEHLLKLTNLTFLKIGQRLPRNKEHGPSFDATTIPTLAKMKSLQTLELFEARFKAADLLPLKDLPALTRLKIHTTDMAPEELEKLKAELPKITVEFRPLSEEERVGTLEKKLRI